MTVVQCYMNETMYKQLPQSTEIDVHFKDLITSSISVNSNYASKLELTAGQLPTQLGNKTECGLLGFVDHLGADYASIRNQYPTRSFVHVYTFNSARKSMSTIVPIPGGLRLFCKGASEMVLLKCTQIMTNKCVKKFSSLDYNNTLNRVIEPMACNGLRTIAVAYKDLPALPDNYDWENNEELINSGLTCLCVCGIQDPVRPEVPEAIRKCKAAGIVVRMVTGDNVATARSIALACGIVGVNDDFLIMEGKEFNERVKDEAGNVVQEKVDMIWPSLRVLARSSPQDKYELVKHIISSKLSANREVVAVTGDGTNDGPALKK